MTQSEYTVEMKLNNARLNLAAIELGLLVKRYGKIGTGHSIFRFYRNGVEVGAIASSNGFGWLDGWKAAKQ